MDISKIVHPSDVFKKHYETIFGRHNKPQDLPIDFLPDLNRKIWGLQKKKLVIVGGRPSMGKSSFLLQLALSLAKQGKTVYFFSFEMSKEVCVERMFSSECEIDNWLLRTGDIVNIADNPEYNIKLTNFYKTLDDMKFMLVETIGRNLPQLNEILKMFPHKPDAVFIDYGNMVETEKSKTRKESLDEYIKGLRALAIHNDFCAIMAAQINRKTHESGKIREPKIWELKETGELEQVSDMVFLLHWQYYYERDPGTKNDYIINIAKNRDGRTAQKKILFFPEYSKFKEVENDNTENDRRSY